MAFYRLVLQNGDRVVVEDSRSATTLALSAEIGALTFSGDIDFEGEDAAHRGTVTFPKGSVLAIFAPDDEDELVMNDEPATADIAGTMYNLVDGKFAGVSAVESEFLDEE